MTDSAGGPESLKWEDVTVGSPGPGEVRLRHTAVGLNFIDVYHRTGLYSVGGLPVTLGLEGAGEIDDRQAAAMMLQGLTAQYLLCGAAELFEVVLRAAVRIEVNQSYPLAEAARAHRDLKGRRTKGSSVLLP